MANLLNIKDLVEELRIPESSVRRLLTSGKIPAMKIGKHWRIPRTYLEKYINTEFNKPLSEKLYTPKPRKSTP